MINIRKYIAPQTDQECQATMAEAMLVAKRKGMTGVDGFVVGESFGAKLGFSVGSHFLDEENGIKLIVDKTLVGVIPFQGEIDEETEVTPEPEPEAA